MEAETSKVDQQEMINTKVEVPFKTSLLLTFYKLKSELEKSKKVKDKKLAKEIDADIEYLEDNMEMIDLSKDADNPLKLEIGIYTYQNNQDSAAQIKVILAKPYANEAMVKMLHLEKYQEIAGDELKVVKATTFKQSRFLVEQGLKYNYPKEYTSQLELFNRLDQSVKDKIMAETTEIDSIVEGIRLTGPEHKLQTCLSKLLDEKSQTTNPAQPNYYAGNMQPELSTYGSNKARSLSKDGQLIKFESINNVTTAPKLSFTLYELAKEYKGGEAPSGKDIANVKAILDGMSEKKFLISYIEQSFKKDGGRIERKIEEFQPLVKILKLSQVEFDSKDTEQSKKVEYVVLLNPLYKHQIDTNHIIYPSDILKRTKIAYGNHDIPEIVIRLRELLIHKKSYKNYVYEMGADRLYHFLHSQWMRESRKKKVLEYTNRAIKTCETLGLLSKWELVPNANGELKYVFYINKDWQ